MKKYIKQNKVLFSLLFPLISLRRLILKYKTNRFEVLYNSIFESVEEGSLVVRVPDFQGIFEIDFRSHILMRLLKNKRYEPELVEIVKKHVDPRRDILDIGANIGLFSILFSKIISEGSRVLAVEPTPMALEHLRRNIERNGCSESVIVFGGVATNKGGNSNLNTIHGMEEYSSICEIVHPSVQGRPQSHIEVQGSTIDNLVKELNLNPGFIKIDTEGAESLVINGAIKTLKKYKPVILSELSDTLLSGFGETSERVIKSLQGIGYNVVDAENPGVSISYPYNGEILALPE